MQVARAFVFCGREHLFLKAANLRYRFHIYANFHMFNALFLVEGFDDLPAAFHHPIAQNGRVAYFREVHLHADALFCGSLASADFRHIFRCGFADHCYTFLMAFSVGGITYNEAKGTDKLAMHGELLALHCGACDAVKMWLYPWFNLTIPWPDRIVRVSDEYKAAMEVARLAELAAGPYDPEDD